MAAAESASPAVTQPSQFLGEFSSGLCESVGAESRTGCQLHSRHRNQSCSSGGFFCVRTDASYFSPRPNSPSSPSSMLSHWYRQASAGGTGLEHVSRGQRPKHPIWEGSIRLKDPSEPDQNQIRTRPGPTVYGTGELN